MDKEGVTTRYWHLLGLCLGAAEKWNEAEDVLERGEEGSSSSGSDENAGDGEEKEKGEEGGRGGGRAHRAYQHVHTSSETVTVMVTMTMWRVRVTFEGRKCLLFRGADAPGFGCGSGWDEEWARAGGERSGEESNVH